jgi:hypothetical protein
MIFRSFSSILAATFALTATSVSVAQTWEQPPAQQAPAYDGYGTRGGGSNDAYAPNSGSQSYGGQSGGYGTAPGGNNAYRPSGQGYGEQSPSYSNNGYSGSNGGAGQSGYGGGSGGSGGYTDPGEPVNNGGYGQPYSEPPPEAYDRRDDRGPGSGEANTYNQSEIVATGHGFFGAVSKGLAGAVEYAFKSEGRPNGYILGEDAGGAFVVGLRYGEGRLYTKDAGEHKIYWQGPSLGYDAGAEGSKTMVLVYNLRDPSEIFNRFGGAEGSAYLVGGVSVQFQTYGDIKLGIIRSGVGVRLGANIGYLKYTRTPTWNPL